MNPLPAWMVLGIIAVPGAVSAAGNPTAAPPSPSAELIENPTTLTYPGPTPGRAGVARVGEWVALSNAILAARWKVDSQGLRGLSLLELNPQQKTTVTGDLFEIVLGDGVRYASSRLRPDGEPRTLDVTPIPRSARLADRKPGKAVEIPLRSVDRKLRLVWRSILHDDANAVRQEITLAVPDESQIIREVVWIAGNLPGPRTVGSVDGSPIVAGSFFLGAENPHARNSVRTNLAAQELNRVTCTVPIDAVLQPGQSQLQSFVIGVAPPKQMRRAFAYYLEQERAHPYRTYLHYNSWYDIAWKPFALNETNCLEAIRLWGERFLKPYRAPLQAVVFDDGWDDPKTLWQFHAGFPNGFAPLADACRAYGTHLGVWLSPFGGYGEPKRQRLEFGRAQGYETNPTGFSLAGPKYYAAFKAACINMIRSYGVTHFKFDGIAAGMYADGSADYLLDTEAMRRLMRELRQEDPSIYINLTTGSWPSPFWLRYADSIWRQGGDMGLAGKGSHQHQWLTYRDQETYRNIVRKGPLYPLNSLMTQGVAYSRQGSAGDPSFNSAGFKDDVRTFFASGTGLQELYVQPGKLTDQDWQVLAEAASWSHSHADVLVDTHWIGGDPGQLEVYGWAAWSGQRGTISLRNPDDTHHSFALELGRTLELPPNSPSRFQLSSPWREDSRKPRLTAQVGSTLSLDLQPFQTLVLEVIPIAAQ